MLAMSGPFPYNGEWMNPATSALLKSGRLGKRPFRLKDLPNYILMELWMIWNMVPYLWYRLVIVKFDLK